MRFHRKAFRGGPSKHREDREGGASRADRRGVPVDALLPAPEWPPRPVPADPAAVEVFSESTLEWMRQNVAIDLAQADDFEAQAAELLDMASRLRRRGTDFGRYLEAHDAGSPSGPLPSGDDYYNYDLPAAPGPQRPLGLTHPLNAPDPASLRPYWVPEDPQDGGTRDLAALDGLR